MRKDENIEAIAAYATAFTTCFQLLTSILEANGSMERGEFGRAVANASRMMANDKDREHIAAVLEDLAYSLSRPS